MTPSTSSLPQNTTLSGRRVFIWLLSFFAVIAAMNAVMITLAFKTMPGLEVKSSYQASLAFPQKIRAAQTQDALNWRVEGRIERKAGGVVLNLSARDEAGKALVINTIEAELARPAENTPPQSFVFSKTAEGLFEGKISTQLPAGTWALNLKITDALQRSFLSENRLTLP